MLLRTECQKCGASFANPTKANVHHLRQHEPEKLKALSEKPIWNVEWGRDGSLRRVLRGPNPPNNRVETRSGETSTPEPSKAITHPDAAYRDSIWGKRPARCTWCGGTLEKHEADGHHLIPRAWDGSDDVRNLCLVHGHLCHDEIEEWTERHGRPPGPDDILNAREFGYVTRITGG